MDTHLEVMDTHLEVMDTHLEVMDTHLENLRVMDTHLENLEVMEDTHLENLEGMDTHLEETSSVCCAVRRNISAWEMKRICTHFVSRIAQGKTQNVPVIVALDPIPILPNLIPILPNPIPILFLGINLATKWDAEDSCGSKLFTVKSSIKTFFKIKLP